jgi:hypothetical protein
MPKMAAELSAIEIKRLKHPGGGHSTMVAAGGVSGLYLQLLPSGGKSWILCTLVAGKRREIGLGGFPDVTLAQARERAREAKDAIRRGIDPIEERKAARASLVAARKRGLVFKDAVDQYLTAKLEGFRNEKHRYQWRATLETYAVPTMGEMLVAEIAVQDVQRALGPIWTPKTETATRLRGQIEAVLDWWSAPWKVVLPEVGF